MALSTLIRGLKGILCFVVTAPVVAQVSPLNSSLQQSAADRGVSLTVRLEGGHVTENLSAVLNRLAISDVTQKRAVDISGAIDISAALEKANGWPRGTVTSELEESLCTMNPTVCQKRSDGKTTWNFQRAGSGSACGVLPANVLCVPDLPTTSYRTLQTRSFRPDENLSALVKQAGACSRLDEKCRAELTYLNRGDFESGKIRLLVDAYQVPLNAVGKEEEEKIEKIVIDAKRAQSEQKRLSNNNNNIFITKPTKLRSEASSASTSSNLKVDLASVFKQVSWPGLEKIQMFRQVDIGVLDRRVDAEHCVLQRKRVNAIAEKIVAYQDLGDSLGLPIPPARDKECSLYIPEWRNMIAYDHATHIIGILAGQKHKNGFVGLVPSATIWLYEVGPRSKPAGDPIANAMIKGFRGQVVNVSQTFEDVRPSALGKDSTPYITRLIVGAPGGDRDSWSESILFVMAAGRPQPGENPEIRTRDNCKVYPACWSLAAEADTRALLSVVALDSRGGVLRAPSNASGIALPLSRYGPVFDVGAPGQASSSYYGDSFGPMEGSSVATPFVTALGALINAKIDFELKGKRFEPKEVADRIRFTSDTDASLKNIVRFGRVNFERALEFRQDKASWTAKDGKKFEASGYLNRSDGKVKIKDGLRFNFAKGIDEPLPNGFEIAWSSIRRIVYVPSRKSHWIFAINSSGNLERYADVLFSADQSVFLRRGLASSDDQRDEIAVSSIQDLTSCSFSKQRCGSN